MTPRQIDAYLFLKNQRRTAELMQLLSTIALGAQGDGKSITDQIKQWQEDL